MGTECRHHIIRFVHCKVEQVGATSLLTQSKRVTMSRHGILVLLKSQNQGFKVESAIVQCCLHASSLLIKSINPQQVVNCSIV